MFVWWCLRGGDFVVVFAWWCLRGGVFVVVFLWWCLCGGVFVVVFESSQHIVRVIRAKVQSIKVVTNHSIGTCSVDLYILYLFETSGTASCGTTGICWYFSPHVVSFDSSSFPKKNARKKRTKKNVGPRINQPNKWSQLELKRAQFFFRSSTPDGILNEFEGDLPIGYTNPFHLPGPYGIKEIPTMENNSRCCLWNFRSTSKSTEELAAKHPVGGIKKNATFPMVLQVRKTVCASKISEPSNRYPY